MKVTDISYPVSILWAHPRSMSTAMEKMMRERGDCQCLHEPFMYYYYVHLDKKEMPFFDIDPAKPTSFDDILDSIFGAADSKPVFAKDMAYYVLDALKARPELASRIRHMILVRDPYRSIASFFKLDANIDLEEIGINAQWQLFQWVSRHAGTPPLVLLARHVQSDPHKAASMIAHYIDLPVRPGSVSWTPNTPPDSWAQVATWHEKTLQTNGFHREQSDDETAKEAFNKLAEANPQLNTMLDAHWQSYTSLVAVGDQQWMGSAF